MADKKVMDNAVGDLTKIAGQKPVVTKAKKAIAGFKIREGLPIGCMVTLRGVQMSGWMLPTRSDEGKRDGRAILRPMDRGRPDRA